MVWDLSRSANQFVRKFKFKYEGLPSLAAMFLIIIVWILIVMFGNIWVFPGVFQELLDILFSHFCLLVYDRLAMYSLECLGHSLHVGDHSAFLLFCILTMAFFLGNLLPSSFVRSHLQNSGRKYNENKSGWEPRQIGEWLGIVVDTIQFTFFKLICHS